MKTTGLTKHLHTPMAALLAVVVLLAGAASAQAQKIAARPLTPQEIHDNSLPAGTIPSGGLLVVGIGEPVYLEVQVPKATTVSSVTWSITERPLAVPASTATFVDSPITSAMPIYSPGDREVSAAFGRKMLVPDAEGKFKVKAVVNASTGTVELEAVVVGAKYVGVGTMGGATPKFPQCALCHEEQAVKFMGTGHASFFEEAIDGIKSSHYGEGCIDCHNLGGHAPNALNDNFAQTAAKVNWAWPATLQPGNWAAMPLELKAKANIQCEHCHGAGSMHRGDFEGTAVSLSSGDCGQCHDEEPYHNKNQEWNLSRHAVATRYPTGEGRASCVGCHSGIGFIERLDGVPTSEADTSYEAIVCASCHDPHSADNPGQLRTIADITLGNGAVVTEGGTGKLCMSCHKGRRNAEEYVKGNVSSSFGPHHSLQGDMLAGENAIEFGKEIVPSKHKDAVENTCASCHIQSVARGQPGYGEAGGHTFKMVWDKGTADTADDVDMVGVCKDCHGEIEDFNFKTVDYNLDGKLEGVQTEIHHMLESLAMLLPPIGQPTVTNDSKYPYTLTQKKALFNYHFVDQDGSHGIHNTSYAVGLLKEAITALKDPHNAIFGGMNIPVGGDWFYSPWFEFYSPDAAAAGWIYHYEHGHLYVSGDAAKVYLYDLRQNKWFYTSPTLYPNMYEVGSGTWFYYGGRFKQVRYFYNYASGQWVSVN